MGAAGMTYEKGNAKIYARRSTTTTWRSTRRSTSRPNTRQRSLDGWVKQWGEAIEQGQRCELQKNSLVSPLHDTIEHQPPASSVRLLLPPDEHPGTPRR